MRTYDEWKVDTGDDDPDGTAADAQELAEDMAEHPERYEAPRIIACADCLKVLRPDENHECAAMRRRNRRAR